MLAGAKLDLWTAKGIAISRHTLLYSVTGLHIQLDSVIETTCLQYKEAIKCKTDSTKLHQDLGWNLALVFHQQMT